MSLRVGVLGATGAVGQTLLEILAEREFPVAELRPLASARSAGTRVEFAGKSVEVVELTEESIGGLDVVLSSAGGSVSAEWAPRFVAAGAVVVDNTSYWRMDERVPLVISEVNPDAAAAHEGIVANPNCTTMAMLVALAALHRAAGIERIVMSSYQSASGTGRRAIAELRAQNAAIAAGEEIPAPEVYPHQLAYNVIPQVESFKDGDDYTTEERKVMAETRKILAAGPEMSISATCVRVPVLAGHSESINLRTSRDLSPEECRELLSEAPGVIVVDSPSDAVYPLALDAAGRDEVLAGRIRRDPSEERTLNLWVVGDNLRKGAALNAVQVAELLAERDLLRVPAGRSLAA